MRMGSDSGRNFLSTKDPVKSKIACDDPEKPDNASNNRRPLSLNEVLGRFFIGRKIK